MYGCNTTNDDGLDDPGGQRVGAEDGVDGTQIQGVEIAPVRGRGFRGRHGPGGFGEGETVAVHDAQGEGVVGDLVEGAGQRLDGGADVEGGGDAEHNGQCQNQRQRRDSATG